jgi:Holliday junction resolvase RusA-like endonuclease
VAWTKDSKPFIHVYPDPDTVKYETALAWAAKAAMRGRPPLRGAVTVVMWALMPVPGSWSNRKRDSALAGVIRPTTRPDWDNFAKTLDAFKGIVWKDDTQIVDGRVVKFYAERPLLRIEIAELAIELGRQDENQAGLCVTRRCQDRHRHDQEAIQQYSRATGQSNAGGRSRQTLRNR